MRDRIHVITAHLEFNHTLNRIQKNSRTDECGIFARTQSVKEPLEKYGNDLILLVKNYSETKKCYFLTRNKTTVEPLSPDTIKFFERSISKCWKHLFKLLPQNKQ